MEPTNSAFQPGEQLAEQANPTQPHPTSKMPEPIDSIPPAIPTPNGLFVPTTGSSKGPFTHDLADVVEGAMRFHNRPMSRTLANALQTHYVHKIDAWTSTGFTDEYLDGIGALLAYPQRWRSYFLQRIGDLWPVGTGRSGAVILGLLGFGTLWNGDKKHGIAWANYPVPPTDRTWPVLEQFGVCLVDDCTFTGQTLRALRAACAQQGMVVEKEVVAFPWQPIA